MSDPEYAIRFEHVSKSFGPRRISMMALLRSLVGRHFVYWDAAEQARV